LNLPFALTALFTRPGLNGAFPAPLCGKGFCARGAAVLYSSGRGRKRAIVRIRRGTSGGKSGKRVKRRNAAGFILAAERTMFPLPLSGFFKIKAASTAKQIQTCYVKLFVYP
jgi:hypothetical protein